MRALYQVREMRGERGRGKGIPKIESGSRASGSTCQEEADSFFYFLQSSPNNFSRRVYSSLDES